jgi:AAHS family 4-hydroxybenzoate transporter-like MFS transporter
VTTSEKVYVDKLIDERPLSGLQLRVIVLCSLVIFLDGYDIQTLAVSVNRLSKEWQLTRADFTLAQTAALMGYALSAALVAGLGDRWGRRPILIAATALMGMASLFTALSDNVAQLAFWRFLTGMGFGASVPNATAITSEYVPVRRRAKLITIMYANIALGAVVAGFAAPSIYAAFGWEAVFILGGVGPIIICALLVFLLPESVRFLIEKRPGDRRIEAIVSRLAPDVDARNATVAARSGIQRQSVFALLAPAFRARTLLLWLGVSLNLFSLFFLISWLPALLNTAGWSDADASRGGVMLQIGGIISGLIMAWYVDRGRTVPAMVTAYLVTAASLGLFLVLPSDSGSWWLLLLTIGAGTSGTQFAFNALSAAFYPSLIRSTGVGWAVGVGRIGAVLGPAFGGFIVRAQLATPQVLGLLVIPVLLCAVSVMFLPRVWRETDQQPPRATVGTKQVEQT